MTSVSGPGAARVRRLALVALAGTWLQVAWGAFTRGSGSGFGCRDRWPLCDGGLVQIGDAGGLLPRPEFTMVVEWLHRWIALVVGVLLVWLAVTAWRQLRDERRITAPLALAVVLVVAQSLVGAAVVVYELRADLVVVHLLGALALLGLLAYATVNSFRLPGPRPPRPPDAVLRGGWSRQLAVGAGVVLATMVLGSTVHNQYVAGWPLVGGRWVPDAVGDSALVTLHYLHRLLAGVGLLVVAWLAWRAHRRRRPVTERRLVDATAGLFVANIGLGAVHVVTEVSSTLAVVAHLGVGAACWAAAVAAWTLARRHDELRGRPGRVPRTGPARAGVASRPHS